MEKWPNFFIVGAERAGTTSLYHYLKQTPGVYMSPIKEPSYFCNIKDYDKLSLSPIRDKTSYLALFKEAKDEIAVGEASPLYLWDPQSAKRIYEVVPEARIIISLRDPVERAFSYFLLNSHGLEKLSFHDAIRRTSSMVDYKLTQRYLDEGLYFKQVQRFLNVFGSKQVKILIFEEWIKDVKETVQELLRFLGVNAKVSNSVEMIHNPFSVPRVKLFKNILGNPYLRATARKVLPSSALEALQGLLFTKSQERPQMLQVDRTFLQEFYREDVKKLEEILQCKLLWHVTSL